VDAQQALIWRDIWQISRMDIEGGYPAEFIINKYL
jgi:hypothetical protein